MYNILKRQYNYFIRGVIRINEEVQRNWTYWFKRFVKLCLLSKNYPFGSHAYGTPNEDSEFDLCIVVEGVGARKGESLIVSIGVFTMLWKHKLIF